jgi:hypothetical protein
MGEPRSREADQIEDDGDSLAAGCRVVLWREPDRQSPYMGIAQRIVLEHPGGMFQDDQTTIQSV